MKQEDRIFQYHADMKFPIYVRLSSDLGRDFANLLFQMKFYELPHNEREEFEKKEHEKSTKILSVTEASAPVAKQINNMHEGDRFGQESIISREGYKVYRYKSLALVVFSFKSTQWKMGCVKNFGSESHKQASKIVLCRFLSWALAHHGLVGFWGVPVEEGMVVLRPIESQGEAVFVDVRNHQVLTFDGLTSLSGQFQVLRLDPTVKNKKVSMSSEQLLSFLSVSSTYLDSTGLSVPIRQLIQTFSKNVEGAIYPKEQFLPRADLSMSSKSL